MGSSSDSRAKQKKREAEVHEDQPVKLIKRYTNRKLYDTVESRYLTLDEIAEMIRTGEDVRIVDNRSKEDLTSITLAQIIFEQEKKRSRMPLGVLHNIVRHGGESVQDFFEREIQPRVVSIREGAETRFEKMFRREKGERTEAESISEESFPVAEEHPASPTEGDEDESAAPEKESAAIARMLSELRDSIETWQRCLDHRLVSTMRDAAKLPVRAMNIPALRKSVALMRARLEELDKKLGDLEKEG